MKKLLKEIKKAITTKVKPPDCFSDENFVCCWCGKCKQKGYELPEDLKKAIIIKAVETYKSNNQ